MLAFWLKSPKFAVVAVASAGEEMVNAPKSPVLLAPPNKSRLPPGGVAAIAGCVGVLNASLTNTLSSPAGMGLAVKALASSTLSSRPGLAVSARFKPSPPNDPTPTPEVGAPTPALNAPKSSAPLGAGVVDPKRSAPAVAVGADVIDPNKSPPVFVGGVPSSNPYPPRVPSDASDPKTGRSLPPLLSLGLLLPEADANALNWSSVAPAVAVVEAAKPPKSPTPLLSRPASVGVGVASPVTTQCPVLSRAPSPSEANTEYLSSPDATAAASRALVEDSAANAPKSLALLAVVAGAEPNRSVAGADLKRSRPDVAAGVDDIAPNRSPPLAIASGVGAAPNKPVPVVVVGAANDIAPKRLPSPPPPPPSGRAASTAAVAAGAEKAPKSPTPLLPDRPVSKGTCTCTVVDASLLESDANSEYGSSLTAVAAVSVAPTDVPDANAPKSPPEPAAGAEDMAPKRSPEPPSLVADPDIVGVAEKAPKSLPPPLPNRPASGSGA